MSAYPDGVFLATDVQSLMDVAYDRGRADADLPMEPPPTVEGAASEVEVAALRVIETGEREARACEACGSCATRWKSDQPNRCGTCGAAMVPVLLVRAPA